MGSQALNIASGFLKALLVPLVCTLHDYAYWQIYAFYAVYVGIFTLGYNDGIYLRFGGSDLEAMAKPKFRTANLIYLHWLVLCGLALSFVSTWSEDVSRQFIFSAIALNVVVAGLTGNVFLTLQCTGKMKEFSILNSIDKTIFIIGIVVLISLKKADLYTLIYLDMATKLVVFGAILWKYGYLFKGKFVRARLGAEELVRNIGSGSNLLIANLAGMLVLGAGRIVVEFNGEIANYAHYAFAVSIANVVLSSVTALSIVIYPSLRRQPSDRHLESFSGTCTTYSIFLFLMLSCYFPSVIFIENVAVKFEPVLAILNAMFVITVMQGKMQLVNNTYFKVLRLERPMLIANLVAVSVVIPVSLVGYALSQTLAAIAFATLAVMVLLVYGSEFYLRRRMGGALPTGALVEVGLLVLFMTITTICKLPYAIVGWICFGSFVAYMNRAELAKTSDHIRIAFG